MGVLDGPEESMAGTFNTQNVANTLWVYARMGRDPGGGLMGVLERQTEAVTGSTLVVYYKT
jgi:hypothetical protein